MAEQFEVGRYLYCVVAVDENTTADGSLSVLGIDDEPVSVLTENGVGAVVQSCESPYDTDDIETVRDWLLTHQEVIDTAGEQFGTPLPFRFDTILKGDDDRVRTWLADQRETLEAYLADFGEHWEYRVGVAWDDDRVREEFESEDEELGDLNERIEEANEGTAFLLEKQYDARISDLRQMRKEELTDRLHEELEPLVRKFEVLDSRPGILSGAASDEVVQVAFLAHEEREAEIGDVLDGIAADPGVEVRFTGPWPPYSFAPELEA